MLEDITPLAIQQFFNARQHLSRETQQKQKPSARSIRCDKICDMHFRIAYYRRKNRKNRPFVIGFVIKKHKKRREVIVMNPRSANDANIGG